MMRLNEKHMKTVQNKEIFGINFHQFIELEEQYNHLEISTELGISLKEVNMLKKRINRT